jgi:hypothetical protein
VKNCLIASSVAGEVGFVAIDEREEADVLLEAVETVGSWRRRNLMSVFRGERAQREGGRTSLTAAGKET